MKLTILIPDNAFGDVEECCRRESGMSFQEWLQQAADDYICKALADAERRSRVTGVSDGRI